MTLIVIEALVPVMPSTIALIVALPGPTAVIKPLAETVTTFVLLLLQFVTAAVTVTPAASAKLAVAAACCVVPPTIVVD